MAPFPAHPVLLVEVPGEQSRGWTAEQGWGLGAQGPSQSSDLGCTF